MSKTRETLTDERNEALYERYNEIIKELNAQGLEVTARKRYEMAAEGFFITGQSAGDIIKKMIKNSKNKKTHSEHS